MSRRGNKGALPAPARWRTWAVSLVFVVAAVVLAWRGFSLQILDYGFLTKRAREQHIQTLDISANRGAIVDRNGKPLALSAPTETVWAVPSALLKAKSEKLASVADKLELSTRVLKKKLKAHSGSQFYYLKRQLSPFKANQIRSLNAPGVFFKRVYKRFYPVGPAAAQVLGLTNIDGKGLSGVERAANKTLAGTPGKRRVVTNRLGDVVNDLGGFDSPKSGQKVKLTIDARIQTVAYRALKKAVDKQQASNGAVVVLNPNNGRILALASVPSFNPNNRSSITSDALRMRPATDVMEPGSSIKPILISGALNEDVWSLSKRIETRGYWRLNSQLTIHDTHNYGTEGIARILKKSSNIGAAHIGLDMGARKVWQNYRDFGFGQKTSVNFPGQRAGTLRPFTQWNKIETATASYGYGVGVTPLQLARAYAAIANNGMLPSLKLFTGHGGQVHTPARRVVSQQTAMTMRRLLHGVVKEGGTAERARLAHYDVAGKTGTARLVKGSKHTKSAHRANFIGMAPAADPELVTLVMVENPAKGTYYGGTVAAPVFKRVMRQALHIMNVAPSPVTLAANDGETVKVAG
ncbi:penicillin-binding protein 2 [Salinisphaera sp. USBA-960]|uniref:peptidoglycan D,D-transpeptidase FtsI family protein n=1 Tax=Salinisphaera orenii TaxID=856731 RepID=UPI000DBE37DB|nr:penicillin-binding protein 2 [Salifodinibacter halophilus]NNC26764.1 penicillin-binding protein 2 [Salifodinibacter halophilus]